MELPRDSRVLTLVAAFGLTGWILWGFCYWSHREPEPSVADRPRIAKELHDAGFGEATVQPQAPTAAKPTVKVKGATIIHAASGAVAFAEEAPPQVFGTEPTPEAPCDVVGPPRPNWELKPGHLSLQDWHYQLDRVGRRPFFRLSGTLAAWTPEGVLTRPFVTDPNDESGWVDPRELARGRYFHMEYSAATNQTFDVAFRWGRDRGWGWGAGPGWDQRDRTVYARITVQPPWP